VAGLLRGGRWFRAVPPAVVHGMLSGIGILIVGSQFHAMIDDTPREGGLANLLAIPESLAKTFTVRQDLPHTEAAIVGLITLVVIVGWSRFVPARLRVVPGALVAVTVATAVVNLLGLAVARVEIPRNILAEAIRPHPHDLFDPRVWMTALGLAVVASAETLLCASALDRLHRGPRSNYNRELAAQGMGNAVCGLLGSLPMTAVIVRSSTNVQAGGRTRASAIMHGVWILLFATLGRDVLRLVPISSLAAVLVVTGWKLVDRHAVRELYRHGRSELVTYTVTVATIVATDLLVGVLAGFGVAVALLLLRLSRLHIDVEHVPEQDLSRLHLRGSATFLSLPDIAEALDGIPADAEVHVHLDQLAHLDHAALEILANWERTHEERGGRVMIDWDDVHRCRRLGSRRR
ncbi:MAG: SulP family inorganic anion transporter, partial [Actinomycetota bacterium]